MREIYSIKKRNPISRGTVPTKITKPNCEIQYRIMEFWVTHKYYGSSMVALGLDSDLWQELRLSVDPPGMVFGDMIRFWFDTFQVASKYDRKDGYVWWSNQHGKILNAKLP